MTLINSAVVVLNSMTVSINQTAVWGVPTIINATELSKYRENSYSPQGFVANDNTGMFSLGLPYASSLDEMCDLVAGYLNQPDKDAAMLRQIADYWDYQSEDYVDMFIGAVDSIT